jgi:hypothetical protein
VESSATQGVTLSDTGATSSKAGGAHHLIHIADRPIAGAIHVQAEIDARGSSFTGIALGRGDLSGNFWANLSILFYVSGDRYNLRVGSNDVIDNVDKTVLHDGSANELDLSVDIATRAVTAKINGKVVLSGYTLPESVQLAAITAAGFRFNEPVTPGQPSVRSYRAEVISQGRMKLDPVDVSKFFVVPGKQAALSWRVSDPGPATSFAYVVRDYEGCQIGSGTGVLSPDQTVTVTRIFPRGYSELYFPEADQTFGVVSLEPHVGSDDPFFCIDSAMSWLELNPTRRASLVEILSRSGIAMARERLGLDLVVPSQGKLDWEGGGGHQLDSIRKMYAQNNVPILEILDGNSENLPEFATGVVDAAQHWSIWGGVEASNEPDLKAMPADQYVPLVKTLSYAFKEAHSRVPLVSGVFATIPPGPFFDTCVSNGMLDDSDAVSFHSYDRATDVEGAVSCYRVWLKKGGKEEMPLWLTECGWSWVLGPVRPPQDQDAVSALEISAKAVESRACGVTRYFPFVYVYYEEGQKNFGMMGREATPLRSMAAYTACIQALSGTRYLGDLQGLGPSVKLARVFGGSSNGECVAVVYTGNVDPKSTIPFPVKVTRVAGADGRTLDFGGGDVPVPDGMSYVWINRRNFAGKLKAETHAMQLSRMGQHPLAQERLASPLVLQFLAQQTPARASARGYLISPESTHALPLNVRISNLSQSPIAVTPTLSLPGGTTEKALSVTVPAMGHSDIAWKLDVSSALDIAQTRLIEISGHAGSGIQPLPLAIPFVMEGTWKQHLARHPKQLALPITDLSHWVVNIAAQGRSVFSVTQDGAWRMDVTFTGNRDKWVYPKFKLPEKIDTNAYSGFLIRARILHDAGNVALIAESDGSLPSFWVSDLFPADGAWHVVYVPFADFKVGPGGAGDQNTRLNPTAWKRISIGMGSHTAENALEVSNFMLVGGNGN